MTANSRDYEAGAAQIRAAGDGAGRPSPRSFTMKSLILSALLVTGLAAAAPASAAPPETYPACSSSVHDECVEQNGTHHVRHLARHPARHQVQRHASHHARGHQRHARANTKQHRAG